MNAAKAKPDAFKKDKKPESGVTPDSGSVVELPDREPAIAHNAEI